MSFQCHALSEAAGSETSFLTEGIGDATVEESNANFGTFQELNPRSNQAFIRPPFVSAHIRSAIFLLLKMRV
jgi:hypothetical protein